MVWTKSTKFSKRSRKPRSRKYARKSNKLSKGLRKAITKVIRKEEETKCQQYNGVITLGAAGGNFQTQGFVPLTPYGTYCSISQGTGQGERVGNQLRIVKATLTYVLCPQGYSLTTNPIPAPQEVLIRLMNPKNTNVLVTSAGNYFQAGSGSVSATGNLNDIHRAVNTDLYTQYKFTKHKIGFAAFIPNPGLNANQGYYANNDFALNVVRTINYTKYCPKIIKFNDNTSTPITRCLQTWIECVNSDGSAMAITTSPILMNYTISIWYKDA